MVDIQEILLLHFRKGESISSISRELKISRKTVRRYINTHIKKNKNPYNEDSISQGLMQSYRYDSSNRQRIRLTQEVQDKIDYYLLENQKKRQQGLHKQILKSIDIHELLSEEGITIAYSTVSHYVSQKLLRTKEAFIKQIYVPGHACEFDWGEVKLRINGQLIKYQLAVFTHSYSNYRYARLYTSIMDFSDLEAANNHLDMILDRINAKTQIGTNKAAIELLKEEKEYLLKAPKAYNYYQIANSHVDKYSTIRYQNNIYSVPDKYVGKLLSLRLYPEHIEIFFNEDYICTHKRSYKLQEWQIKLEHYIPTLTTKPGALHSSMALKQTDVRLQEIYNSYFTNKSVHKPS